MIDIGILEILIVILVCFVIFVCYQKRQVNLITGASMDLFSKDVIKNPEVPENVELFEKSKNYIRRERHGKKRMEVKPIFIEMMFHNDYRDTLTAFNDLTRQKQVFNQSNSPTEYTEMVPNDNEITFLIKQFIRELNKNVINNSAMRNSNSGWDELLPEEKVVSGWEKQQILLGLPKSLYEDPAPKNKIRLLKIDSAEKFATDQETKYVVQLIIQKLNVDDQMIVKISFVQDNLDSVNLDREFFDKHRGDRNVLIEEINVVGYLTSDDECEKKDFYNFKSLETGGIIDDHAVVKELTNKYKNKYIDDQIFAEAVLDKMSL
ncbi:MAG: hypothetical protein Harvfovirus11_10 [Harvfovirus sp.]|uniref:Uncharacterized protein n=1 Tax=Harvfovirus sp. TaxID=2487768 RepID=A0A3G5A155_9VIRU|nr:MAG: hypothetical protein Harvfovirus11_10 [Harvfovirus sp.]